GPYHVAFHSLYLGSVMPVANPFQFKLQPQDLSLGRNSESAHLGASAVQSRTEREYGNICCSPQTCYVVHRHSPEHLLLRRKFLFQLRYEMPLLCQLPGKGLCPFVCRHTLLFQTCHPRMKVRYLTKQQYGSSYQRDCSGCKDDLHHSPPLGSRRMKRS